MEEFSRKHVQRLRRENNNEVALVEKETKEEEGVLLSETCRVFIERIHNNQSTTCRKRLKRRKHLKIPEYIANRAAISLYRSMVLEPDVEEGGEETFEEGKRNVWTPELPRRLRGGDGTHRRAHS